MKKSFQGDIELMPIVSTFNVGTNLEENALSEISLSQVTRRKHMCS